MIKSVQSHAATVLNFSHVLISRPEAESLQLAAQVHALGLVPVVMPAFRFQATGIRVTADDDWRNAGARLAVFTSPRAVQYGLPAAEAGLLSSALVGAIGPATAAALEQGGLQVDLQAGRPFTSESFLALEAVASGRGAAIIFAAPGGREALQSGLRARGWTVREALVYEREACPPGAAETQAVLGAGRILSVWTSGAAMNWLLDKLPETAARKLLSGKFVVASERLAELARERGAACVQVAGGADNPSLLEALAEAA